MFKEVKPTDKALLAVMGVASFALALQVCNQPSRSEEEYSISPSTKARVIPYRSKNNRGNCDELIVSQQVDKDYENLDKTRPNVSINSTDELDNQLVQQEDGTYIFISSFKFEGPRNVAIEVNDQNNLPVRRLFKEIPITCSTNIKNK